MIKRYKALFTQAMAAMYCALAAGEGLKSSYMELIDVAEQNWKSRHSSAVGLRGRARQEFDLVGVIITIGIAAIVTYVIVFAGSETQDAAGFNETAAANDPGNATRFDNASLSITEGVESFASILVVVFIVLILVVAVGALTLLRRR